jgi:hypothetical protein
LNFLCPRSITGNLKASIHVNAELEQKLQSIGLLTQAENVPVSKAGSCCSGAALG